MKIKVFRYDQDHYIPDEKYYEKTINRKPFHNGFVGNFVPHFTRYNRSLYLIHGSIDSAYMQGYDDDAYIVLGQEIKTY